MAEACYEPEYFRASYKGIAFDAMEVTSEHGRRGAEGEFPFGENTGYADLGRRIRTYSIRGRFAGNDHIGQSAALIAVVELPGPGPLVHPTRGIVIAACKSLRVEDDPMQAQGVTYVSMEFVEANVWANGFQVTNLLQSGLSLVSLIATTGESFTRDYQPRSAKPYNAEAIVETESQAILQIRDEYHAAAVRGNSTNQNTWKALLDLEQRAKDPSVLLDAAASYRTMRLGMAALSASTSENEMYAAFLRLANQNAKSSRFTGQDQLSQNAIYGSMRILSAAYMAQGALQRTDANAQETFRALGQITAVIGTEIDAARQLCDNNLYLELRNFYVATQTALLNRVYTLPALVIYNFRKPVHALVAAYEIYNDARRAGEITNQNPGSSPWGVGPQVIASGT
jgi:hypothetical protein